MAKPSLWIALLTDTVTIPATWHWSGFLSSLAAARAHWVRRGSWFSSEKHFICWNVPGKAQFFDSNIKMWRNFFSKWNVPGMAIFFVVQKWWEFSIMTRSAVSCQLAQIVQTKHNYIERVDLCVSNDVFPLDICKLKDNYCWSYWVGLNQPIIRVIAASWAFESEISSSYRENAL